MIPGPLLPSLGNASGFCQLTAPPGFQLFRLPHQESSDYRWEVSAQEPIMYWMICLEGPIRMRSANYHKILPAHMALMSMLAIEPEQWEIYNHQPGHCSIIVLPMARVKDWLDNKMASNWWPYFADDHSSALFKHHVLLLPLQQEQFFQQLWSNDSKTVSDNQQVELERHVFIILEQVLFNQALRTGSTLANDEERVIGLVSFMLQELDKPITLEFLMQYTGLNVARLQKLCQQLFGESVNGFVQLVRIEKAKELLANSNASIFSIATQVGFSSRGISLKCLSKELALSLVYFEKKVGMQLTNLLAKDMGCNPEMALESSYKIIVRMILQLPGDMAYGDFFLKEPLGGISHFKA